MDEKNKKVTLLIITGVIFIIIMVSIVGIGIYHVIPSSVNSESLYVDQTEFENINAGECEKETMVSGSFTVSVRDVIPDYCMDDKTPQVAVVTEFQSYPFTIFVGEEIGKQLEIGKAYVFSIEPIVVDYPKEYLEKMQLSSLVWELPEFKITDFRPAEENEVGLESLRLKIE